MSKNNEDKKYSSLQSKESRRLKYKKSNRGTLFGLGFIGLVGWSIATPTLVGALLGLWLDKRFPQEFSWTLTLLLAGVIIGALNVWYWVDKENKEIQKEQNDDDE